MIKNIHFWILTVIFSISAVCNAQVKTLPTTTVNGQQKPVTEDQILYNGKVWRNLYIGVKGSQFLFSTDYLQSSVTIGGKTFNNVALVYDVYNDEIITTSNTGYNLQLNKEMVDSFSFSYQNETYRFLNTHQDSTGGVKGFVNVLYKGKSALYIKYKAVIQMLAVDNKYDLMVQSHRIYFMLDGKAYLITGKKDLLKILDNDKIALKAFIKKNKLKVSKKNPESFIAVVRFYDSLSK